MKSSTPIKAQAASSALLRGLAQLIRLPDSPQEESSTENTMVQFFGELGLLDCTGTLEIGICTYKRRALELDQMEQHTSTQELLVAMDDEFIMPIAPSKRDENAPDPERLVAVRMRRGEGIIFNKGIWHWAPFPLRAESFALVGFARGTARDDMRVVKLGERIELCT